MANVYFDNEMNRWMRSDKPTQMYTSKEAAQKAVEKSEKFRALYYERLEKLELDYSLIYNRYVFASDRPDAGSSDPDAELEGGTEKGRGFFRLFVKNSFSDTIPLGDIVNDATKWPDIAEFLRSTMIEYSDPVVRTALARLMSRAGLA